MNASLQDCHNLLLDYMIYNLLKQTNVHFTKQTAFFSLLASCLPSTVSPVCFILKAMPAGDVVLKLLQTRPTVWSEQICASPQESESGLVTTLPPLALDLSRSFFSLSSPLRGAVK